MIMDQEAIVPSVVVRRDPPHGLHQEHIQADPIAVLSNDLAKLTGPHHAEARVLFLLGVSRYCGVACSTALVGPSGAGKTTLANTVCDLMPHDDVESVIDISYAAITSGLKWPAMHGRDGTVTADFRDKLLLIDENTEIRNADKRVLSALRQATSTGSTTRFKMVKGQAQRFTLLGPISLIDCRLNTAEVDYQTANRLTALQMRADEDALNEILKLSAQRSTSAGRKRAIENKQTAASWRWFLRSLDRLEVVVEFADQLLVAIQSRGGRITHGPRILTAVIGVISAVAWLRQNRKRRHADQGASENLIYATRRDYSLALSIMQSASILDERPNIPGPAFELLRRWRDLVGGRGNAPLTAPRLYDVTDLHVDRGNMTRHLRGLIGLELVRECPGRNANRQKLYELTPFGLRAATTNLIHTLPKADAIKITDEEDFNACAEE